MEKKKDVEKATCVAMRQPMGIDARCGSGRVPEVMLRNANKESTFRWRKEEDEGPRGPVENC